MVNDAVMMHKFLKGLSPSYLQGRDYLYAQYARAHPKIKVNKEDIK